MYNDDQTRQPTGSQGSSFVPRRPISNNPRYIGGEKPPYPSPSQGGYSSPSYDRGGYGGSQPRHYGSGPRRHDSGYGGGYRAGGYNNSRGGQHGPGGASFDRVVRQNDIIIKLLKDIRDRLPAPQGGAQQYDSPDTQYSGGDYAEGDGGSYGASGEQAAGGEGESRDFGGDQSADSVQDYQAPQAQGQGEAADDDESRFNS